MNGLVLWLFTFLCVGLAASEGSPTLTIPIYEQFVHSHSVRDIVPRGVVKYDPAKNSAVYEEQSDAAHLTSGEGIYRIGLYNSKTRQFGPAAFTKLVPRFRILLTAGCCERLRS